MLEARSPGGGSLQAGGRQGHVAHCPCAGDQWARDSRCVSDVGERAPGAARVLLHLAHVWSQPTEIDTFQISLQQGTEMGPFQLGLFRASYGACGAER
jgi:hypothetical protein